MSKQPSVNVGSGPVDPDPKPHALLQAVSLGAVVVRDHLAIPGAVPGELLDRWLVLDHATGWILVDAPVLDAVAITQPTLDRLRKCAPIEGSNLVRLHKRHSIRAGLVDGSDVLHVVLCVVP